MLALGWDGTALRLLHAGVMGLLEALQIIHSSNYQIMGLFLADL